MIASRPSLVFVHSVLLVSCVLGFGRTALACLNEYEKDHRQQDLQNAATNYVASLLSGASDTPSYETVQQLELAAKDGDYQAKSDFAVALARTGKAREAVEILNNAEAAHPGEYMVAANLGTAYELSGKDEDALVWIATGVRRNPDAHSHSEWLHVKILEAKIAMAKDPNWLSSHSITGLDFGQGDKPVRPSQMVEDFDGNTQTLLQVRNALEYQLRERMALVPARDAIVASLLRELGDCLNVDGFRDRAQAVYSLAFAYSPGDTTTIRRRIDRVATSDSNVVLYNGLVGLMICLGLVAAAATGWYLRQITQNLTLAPPRQSFEPQ